MRVREFFFNLDLRIKVGGVFIALAVFSYALYSFAIVPLIERHTHMKTSLEAQEGLAQAKQESGAKIKSLEDLLKEKKGKLRQIEARFIFEEELPSFFKELRGIAARHNIEIGALRLGEKKPISVEEMEGEERYEELPAHLSFSGNYLDTVMFLSKIRKESALFSVSRIFMIAYDRRAEVISTNLDLIFYLVRKSHVGR